MCLGRGRTAQCSRRKHAEREIRWQTAGTYRLIDSQERISVQGFGPGRVRNRLPGRTARTACINRSLNWHGFSRASSLFPVPYSLLPVFLYQGAAFKACPERSRRTPIPRRFFRKTKFAAKPRAEILAAIRGCPCSGDFKGAEMATCGPPRQQAKGNRPRKEAEDSLSGACRVRPRFTVM